MNATSIFLGLLIVLFMILLLRWMRKAKPPVTGLGSQHKPDFFLGMKSHKSRFPALTGISSRTFLIN